MRNGTAKLMTRAYWARLRPGAVPQVEEAKSPVVTTTSTLAGGGGADVPALLTCRRRRGRRAVNGCRRRSWAAAGWK